MLKKEKAEKKKEKRRHRRVVVTVVAEIDTVPPGKTFQGYVTNLSCGGLGLFSQSSFGENSKVVVRLTFFGSKGIIESKPIQGVVTRSQTVGSVHSVGIRFIDLDQEDNKHLLAFLESAQKSLAQ